MSGFTDPVPLAVGAAAVAVTSAGNAPNGCTLINRGDHGGTIWVRSGPAGGSLPLTPGGSLQWNDAGTLPYVQLAADATSPETLIVTTQANGFTNPEAVAAATATQLTAQGIPSVFTDADVGTAFLPQFGEPATFDVSQYAALIISVTWSTAQAGAVTLTFGDPTLANLAPITFYCTNDGTFETGTFTWQVPVRGKKLTITNPGVAFAGIAIAGTNRPVDRFRVLGDSIGAKQFAVKVTTAATNFNMISSAPGSNQSLMTGPVQIQFTRSTGTGTGFLTPVWVDPNSGALTGPRIAVTGSDMLIDYVLPAAPVHWLAYFAAISAGGDTFRIAVLQK